MLALPGVVVAASAPVTVVSLATEPVVEGADVAMVTVVSEPVPSLLPLTEAIVELSPSFEGLGSLGDFTDLYG